MKKIALLLILIVTVIGCQKQPNLVLNHSFEEDLTNWTVKKWGRIANATITQEKTKDGNNALLIDSGGVEQDILVIQTVQVEPGSYYLIQAWTLAVNIPAHTYGASIGIAKLSKTSRAVTGTTDWESISLHVKTAENQKNFTIYLRLGMAGKPSSGKAYFDTVMVTKMDSQPAVYHDLTEINTTATKDPGTEEGYVLIEVQNKEATVVLMIIAVILIISVLALIIVIVINKKLRQILMEWSASVIRPKRIAALFTPVKEKLVHSLFLGFLFSIILFWYGPMSILFKNVNEFSFLFKDILLPNIILTLPFIVFFIVILFPFSYSLYKRITITLVAAGVLLLLQWNVFPLYHFGKLDGRIIDWGKIWYFGLDLLVWVGLIVVANVFYKILYSRFKLILLAFTGFLVIVLVLEGFDYFRIQNDPSFDGRRQYEIDTSNKFDFSKNENVIIVVVDEMQSDVFYELIGEEDYGPAFDGFTYYPDTVSGFSYTTGAIPVFLTGKYFDNSVTYLQYIAGAYAGNSIPKVLKQNGFRTDLFPQFNIWTVHYNKNVMSNLKSEYEFKIEEDLYLLDIALFRYVPYLLKPYIYNENSWFFSNIFVGDKHEEQVNRNVLNDFDKSFFSNLANNISVNSDEPVFKFYHLYGTHGPYSKDRHGRRVKPDYSRYRYKEFCVYKLNMVADMLTVMKREGIYDNSTIIILGDHGTGRGPEINVDQRLIGHSFSEDDQVIPTEIHGRGVPMLLIKEKDSRGLLEISDEPKSLSRLPETLFSILGTNLIFDSENGAEEPADDSRRYMFYNFKSIYQVFLPDIFEYEIKGHSWLESSWRGPVRLYPPKKKFQRYMTVRFGSNGNSDMYASTGLLESVHNFHWITDPSSEIYITDVKPEDENYILLQFHKPADSACTKADIQINDTFNYTFKLHEYINAGTVEFKQLRLDQYLVESGKIKVKIKHNGGVKALGIQSIMLFEKIKE